MTDILKKLSPVPLDPADLFFKSLEKGLNFSLRCDPFFAKKLAEFEGFIIKFHCVSPVRTIYLSMVNGQIVVNANSVSKADVSVSGNVVELLMVVNSIKASDKINTIIFDNCVCGDKPRLKKLFQLVQIAEPDWALGFEDKVHPVLAHTMTKMIKVFFSVFYNQSDLKLQVLQEYLQNELALLPYDEDMQQVNFESKKNQQCIQSLEERVNHLIDKKAPELMWLT